MEWIADHANHVVGWILGLITALVGLGWKSRGYVLRIEKLEEDITEIKTAMSKIAEDKDKDSQRIRQLEDAQIRTSMALEQIPEIARDAKNTSQLLLKILTKNKAVNTDS